MCHSVLEHALPLFFNMRCVSVVACTPDKAIGCRKLTSHVYVFGMLQL
jgi:hypothetical protein